MFFRELALQECHLISQDTAIAQDQPFGIIRRIRDSVELHARLLRRLTAFLLIATAAGRYNVVPVIATALAEWDDVVARELHGVEFAKAIHADILIAAKESLIA